MTLPRYVTHGCDCWKPKGMGYPRPTEPCEHGNRFRTEKELERRAGGSAEQSTSSLRASSVKEPLGSAGSASRQNLGAASSSSSPRRKAGLKRTRRRETAAEKRARLHFNATVKARKCWFAWHRPCERCGGSGFVDSPNPDLPIAPCPVCNGDGKHHCEGPKDAHHLVPKQFLRKRFQGVLPEDQFVAILFNPLIGAPLCRKAHDRIEAGTDRIYWEDLTEECVEYVFSLPDFVALRLEEECPKRPTELTVAA